MVGEIAKMPGLIANPGKIWLAVEPVDMRRGIDGLSTVVQQSLEHASCAGSAFLFFNRASNRIKVLLRNGTGVWLGSVALSKLTVDTGLKLTTCAG